MTERLAIGVDIGGTKIAFALVDAHGNVLATHSLPTGAGEAAERIFDRVAEGVRVVMAQAEHPVVGAGMGCPGLLNPITGVIYNATNLGWRNVPLLDEVKRRLEVDIPVWLQKDADAAALGELYFGAARGQSNFVHLTVGTGIGGSAVIDGELIMGAHLNATEVGHIPFDPQGRRCVCGMLGCPEIYAAGVGLMAAAKEYLLEYPSSVLAGGEVTTSAILDAARAGDELGVRIMTEAVNGLCSTVLACIGLFDPGVITMGGGLTQAAPEWYIDVLSAEVNRRFAPMRHTIPPIVASQVASPASGAACLVWHRFRELTQ